MSMFNIFTRRKIMFVQLISHNADALTRQVDIDYLIKLKIVIFNFKAIICFSF